MAIMFCSLTAAGKPTHERREKSNQNAKQSQTANMMAEMKGEVSGDLLALPANRPHENPTSHPRSLSAAYTHAEKLGKLMRVTRLMEGDSAGLDENTFVDYKVSGRTRPVQAVAKFAKESSVLKTCLFSLVRVLYASRSLLFSQPEKCAKGSGNLSKLLCFLDGPPPTSEVPVDSASLELILANAIRKASQEDGEASRSPLAVIANAHVDDSKSSHTAHSLAVRNGGEADRSFMGGADGFGYACDSRHFSDLGFCNDMAHMVAFGFDSSLINSERESHFADGFLGRCGSMTRNTACLDLVELGTRRGVCA